MQSTTIPYPPDLVFDLTFRVISAGLGTVTLKRDSSDDSGSAIGSAQAITSTGFFPQNLLSPGNEEVLGDGNGKFTFDYQFTNTADAEIEVIITIFTADPVVELR